MLATLPWPTRGKVFDDNSSTSISKAAPFKCALLTTCFGMSPTHKLTRAEKMGAAAGLARQTHTAGLGRGKGSPSCAKVSGGMVHTATTARRLRGLPDAGCIAMCVYGLQMDVRESRVTFMTKRMMMHFIMTLGSGFLTVLACISPRCGVFPSFASLFLSTYPLGPLHMRWSMWRLFRSDTCVT